MSNHPPKCTHHLFSGGTVIESDSHGYVDLDSTKAKMVNQKILIMPVETKNAKYSLSLFPAGKDLCLPVGRNVKRMMILFVCLYWCLALLLIRFEVFLHQWSIPNGSIRSPYGDASSNEQKKTQTESELNRLAKYKEACSGWLLNHKLLSHGSQSCLPIGPMKHFNLQGLVDSFFLFQRSSWIRLLPPFTFVKGTKMLKAEGCTMIWTKSVQKCLPKVSTFDVLCPFSESLSHSSNTCKCSIKPIQYHSKKIWWETQRYEIQAPSTNHLDLGQKSRSFSAAQSWHSTTPHSRHVHPCLLGEHIGDLGISLLGQ